MAAEATLQLADSRMERLYRAGLTGMWLVNESLCNLKDLLDCRPGMIVRVRDIHNAVKFVPAEEVEMLGCVAGWLCDDEVSEHSSKTDASGAANG